MKITTLFLEKFLLVVFVLTVNFSLAACNIEIVQESSTLNILHEKSFKTAEGKTLKLKASSGDVFISSSEESGVAVKIFGNDRAKRKMNFYFENDTEGVTVTAEQKDKWNFFSFGRGVSLRYEITVPKRYDLIVSSSGGDFFISNIDGIKEIKTSGGDISLKDSHGKVNASTSGGDIGVTDTDGDLNLSTSGGDITCRTFSGNIQASTSGGDINLSGSSGNIEAKTSGGDISLDYSGENEGIDLRTSGGDIDVKLPDNFNADVQLSSSGGRVRCELNLNNVRKKSSTKLEADINYGGERLICKTSGGDIKVYRKN